MDATRKLLCLHGFTGRGTAWRDVLAKLNGVEAWCPDLLGHNPDEDGPLPDGDFSTAVDRLASEVARRGGGSYLAGYSMGARVGLGLLLRHPGLFTGATLIGVHPGIDSSTARRERAIADEGLAQRLKREGIAAFVEFWEERPLFASQSRLPADRLAEQRALRLGHRASGLARSLRTLGLANMPNYSAQLAALQLPVQLLVGGEDQHFLRLADRILETLPQGTLEVVPGVGHNLVLETPQAVAEAIEKGMR